MVKKLVPFLKTSYQKFKKYSSIIYIFFKIYKICVFFAEHDMFCISNLFYLLIKITNSFLNFFIVKNPKNSDLCDDFVTKNNFINNVNYEERTIRETYDQTNAPFKKTNVSSGEFLYRRHRNNLNYNPDGYLV